MRQNRQPCSTNCGNLVPMNRILCRPCALPSGEPWKPRTVWGQVRKAARDKDRERGYRMYAPARREP